MEVLVGYTGFVGSNLSKQHKFDCVYNSKNIADSFGVSPDLCVYAGIRAEKFTADKFPENDLNHIKDAVDNIKRINPKKLVLVSTVDVIPSRQNTDIYEDTNYETDKLTPYGKNRLFLENEIRNLYPETLILRLPALFGTGLKKNLIFDIINFIPAMLKKEKIEELCVRVPELKSYYKEDENGFFRVAENISGDDRKKLRKIFEGLEFSAVNFTDSRSKFAVYNLEYLWEHIKIFLENDIKLAHMAAEPVSAEEIYYAVYGKSFTNLIAVQHFDYTFFRTRHTGLLGGNEGYIFKKNKVIPEIVEFVKKG